MTRLVRPTVDRPDYQFGDPTPGMHAEPVETCLRWPSTGSGHIGLEQTGTPAALRAQILATEHWSLLATRSMTWSEIFSRTGIFLTVLSAIVVALSLVAHGTGFGQTFRVFALLVLPIGLLIGLGTYVRLVEADIEDVWLVTGMNRIRQAYMQLVPCRPSSVAFGVVQVRASQGRRGRDTGSYRDRGERREVRAWAARNVTRLGRHDTSTGPRSVLRHKSPRR